MNIYVDNQALTQGQLNRWIDHRVDVVLKKLKQTLPADTPKNRRNEALAELKLNMSYEQRTQPIASQLSLSRFGMKVMAAMSGNKRRKARITIKADGITIEKLGPIIDALMLEDTKEHRWVNMLACPDHYALEPQGDTLEVIETTGNTPLPTQFFIDFEDTSSIQEPEDPNYPYQSTGVACLDDGTVIGGVRHQFRNTKTGIEAKILVEFPQLCPQFIIDEHQMHLACEWSTWIQWAIDQQDRY